MKVIKVCWEMPFSDLRSYRNQAIDFQWKLTGWFLYQEFFLKAGFENLHIYQMKVKHLFSFHLRCELLCSNHGKTISVT